jgi:hypothetical protein
VAKKNNKVVIQFIGCGGLLVYPIQTNIMKLTQKFLVVGTIATIASFSQAWANGKEEAEPTPAVEDPAVIPDEEIVVDEEVLVDEVGITAVPEVAICDRTVDGAPIDKCLTHEKGEDVNLEDGGSAPPEVLRGEDGEMNPDLIFYTTALDGGEAPDTTGKVGPAFGSDERAADIEAKGPRITAVKSQKKGPVALVKKGRVFLR